MSQRQADRSSESAEYATDPALSRRTLMGAMAAGAMAAGASPALAQSDGEPDYEGWFDDVDNYDGTVDARGRDQVTVDVGTEGNNGNFAFGPAAVRVSPGTTVVWEWTGKGSTHNVVEQDDEFDSGDPVDEEGKTFQHTFEEEGVYKYVCTPHEAMGMKGAVVVGAGGGGGAGGDGAASGDGGAAVSPGVLSLGGALAMAFLSPLAFAAYLSRRRDDSSVTTGADDPALPR